MDSMKSEVIYNQLVQEFADDDRAPFSEYVGGGAPGADIQRAV